MCSDKLKPVDIDLASPFGRARVFQAGEGTPILLLHGGMGDARQHWEVLTDHIAGKCRIHAPALPSYEGSDPLPNPSWDELVEWVGAVLDGLGLERAYIAGNSFGAATARAFATKYPERVRRLLLINGGLVPPIPAWVGKVLASPILKPLGGLMRAGIYSKRGLRSMIANESVMTEAFIENARTQANHFTPLVLSVGSAGLPDFHNVDIPVTVLWGTNDRTLPIRKAHELASAFAHADVKLIEGAGHMPQLEAPEAFAEALVASLKD